MRYEFGKFISAVADSDDQVLLITGDIGYRVFDDFREKYPARFINIGICEQSMIGVAAGLAIDGYKPWVYTITPFLIERPFEQVKLDIDQQCVNVKLIGYADYPTLGPTHSSIIDKAITDQGLFENIQSRYPQTIDEASDAFQHAYETNTPWFISLTNGNH